jgi:hypothetical protein
MRDASFEQSLGLRCMDHRGLARLGASSPRFARQTRQAALTAFVKQLRKLQFINVFMGAC